MKITKKEDHYLLKNDEGEYHLSLEEFNSLGEKKAIELAREEIKKKLDFRIYPYATINFSQASNLGFCEFGIEDFCQSLSLDLEDTYSIKDLNKGLTIGILKRYTTECLKLFGSNTLKYLGGVKEVLSEDTIDLVLREEFIPEKTLHTLSVKFAKSSLHLFESQYPKDRRPREAIEAKEAFIKGDITKEQLVAARSAAYSAYSAAHSAAYSAHSAAYSAAYSADSAARSAYSADSAARSAGLVAHSAARKEQIKIILKCIKEDI